MFLVLLSLLAGLLGAVIAYYATASRRPRHFPPGPRGLPVIGNAHQVPTQNAFLKFHEWSKELGSIYSLKLGPESAVVLNDWRHIHELFDKRGLIYSSRPDSHIGNEIICTPDTHILFLSYGDSWKRQRRAIVSFMKSNSSQEHLLPIQDAESTQMVFDLLQSPDLCYDHLRRFSTAVILASVYGLRGKSHDNEMVKNVYEVQERLTRIIAPGATPPIDAFPWLKRLPDFLVGWRVEAKDLGKKHRALYAGLFERTKRRAKDGGPLCMLGRLLKDRERGENELTDEHMIYTGVPMLEAGSDTTSSTLQSWIIAMTENREVLRKMQEELDDVCGSEMPKPGHMQRLVYVRAVVMETLRWRPPLPMGVPHRLSQDDFYEGYYLPKDTLVFANAWSLNFDESHIDKPYSFQPERFLANDFGVSGLTDKERLHRRSTYAFGAGRRVCVGQRFAENSLVLAMAKIAWAYDIAADPERPIDSNVVTGYHDGLSRAPKPFQVLLNVRSSKHEATIRRQFEEADSFLASYED